eukprot:366131-Chlamydomonas_euryale.AAC.3
MAQYMTRNARAQACDAQVRVVTATQWPPTWRGWSWVRFRHESKGGGAEPWKGFPTLDKQATPVLKQNRRMAVPRTPASSRGRTSMHHRPTTSSAAGLCRDHSVETLPQHRQPFWVLVPNAALKP